MPVLLTGRTFPVANMADHNAFTKIVRKILRNWADHA